MFPFAALSRLSAAPAPPAWLWEPYLARGTLAVLDGDPGVGKSLLTLDLAARLSRSGPMPDGRPLDRPHVSLLLSAEDSVARTGRPRAEAAGADLANVGFFVARGLTNPRFPDDLPMLEGAVHAHRAGLVVIDTFTAFVPLGPPGDQDRPVRQTLDRLADLAGRSGCAVILVRHLTKTGGLRALHRGLGSLGAVRAVRTGLLLAEHPYDPGGVRVLARTKPASGPALEFRLAPGAGPHPRLCWLGPSGLVAGDLYTHRDPADPRPREQAVEWLRRELADGPRRAAEVLAAAAAAGISRRTMTRAKRDLGVESDQVGRGRRSEWIWTDPATRAGHPRADSLPL